VPNDKLDEEHYQGKGNTETQESEDTGEVYQSERLLGCCLLLPLLKARPFYAGAILQPELG